MSLKFLIKITNVDGSNTVGSIANRQIMNPSYPTSTALGVECELNLFDLFTKYFFVYQIIKHYFLIKFLKIWIRKQKLR